MKTISIFLALINALLAGLIIASNLSAMEAGQARVWWLVTKTLMAACVILIGVITWLGSAHSANLGRMALCSLFLVALGTATVVWALHLALTSGDLEFYMVVYGGYGGSLAVQGLASMFGFAGASGSLVV